MWAGLQEQGEWAGAGFGSQHIINSANAATGSRLITNYHVNHAREHGAREHGIMPVLSWACIQNMLQLGDAGCCVSMRHTVFDAERKPVVTCRPMQLLQLPAAVSATYKRFLDC